ncbi:MAG: NAD+ synthase [Bacteroidales bacterium]
MRIALAQLNYHIGNFTDNTRKIKEAIQRARAQKADLVVFAELAVCGYPPRDFLEFNDFIEQSETSVREIAALTQEIAVIIGAPSVNPDRQGKKLFNSAYFLFEGRIQAIHHKSLLPTYDVFDEYRYFEPNRNFSLTEYMGKKLAITICEDLWMEGTYPLYTLNPMQELAKQSPDLIINIAASPFHYTQKEDRYQVLQANVSQYQLPVVYVNQVGGQTELLFDGGSVAMNTSGEVVQTLQYFEEDMRCVEFEKDVSDSGSNNEEGRFTAHNSPVARIHDALVMGIKDYYGKLGFSKAVLGLSGGIDSAVVLVLAARALGPENVLGVLMPSSFSSDHSINDALELTRNLGTKHEIIPIENTFQSINSTMHPLFKGLPFNIAEENLQARLRAVILMALANKFGYILLNTSNKSEAAVGYGTLYGDMCGAISVLGDLYKTQVYELARYINKNGEIIPENIISKPPSAELRHNQKDSDSLPEYEILDAILYQYIEMRKGPKDLLGMGFDESTVYKTLKMVNTSEHKRYQTPPILRVSSKAFGSGRRMPIAGKYLS